MISRFAFVLTPAQQAQYQPPPDLSPNVVEPEYNEQRMNAARVAGEHPQPVDRGESAGPVLVTDETVAGRRRWRRWTDL